MWYLDTVVGKIDYAFFTGDIRHAPSGDFPSNAGKEIENICNAIGLPEKRLFIVPGNHDVDRNCPEKNKVINFVKKEGAIRFNICRKGE